MAVERDLTTSHLASRPTSAGLRGGPSRAQGDDVSTEDLRIALQRYRSFFDRLLVT
jgi:hypothetical protein